MSNVIPFNPYLVVKHATKKELDFWTRNLHNEIRALEFERDYAEDPEIKLDYAEELYELHCNHWTKAILNAERYNLEIHNAQANSPQTS